MKSKFLLFFFLFQFFAFGQQEEWLQEILEEYVNQNPDGNYDLDQVERELRELISDPVLIDQEHPENLDRLFFLSPIVLKNMKSYLLQNGDFISLYELQIIPGINVKLARNLAKLVRLKSSEFTLKNQKFRGRLSSGINQRIVPSKGYQTNKYLGSAHRFYFRSDFKIGRKIRFGFLYEKDAGEAYWNKNYLARMPHFSGFVELKGKKHIKNIILGDFKMMLGQGLLIYQGYGFGKTIDQPGNVRVNSEVKPNTSLSESFFLRGGAVHFKWNKWSWIGFASYKFLAATLREDSTIYFRSIDLSGSLKTVSEAQKQRNLKEFLGGSSFRYRGSNLEIGLNYLHSQYNHLYRNQEQVYQVFNTPTKSLDHLSVDYKYYFRNGLVFGENAFYFQSKGLGLLNGVLLALSEKTSLMTHIRYFSPKYFSFYAAAISENSKVQNELGLYLNLKHEFNRRIHFSIYMDYFLFPWLKFNVDAPSSGFEINTRLKYRWNRKMEVYFNYRIKSKEENWANAHSANTLKRVYKQQFRVHFSRKFGNDFAFSTRLEGNLYKWDTWTTGLLFYLNFQYKPGTKWVLNYRLNYFTTDSFDNAIYSLERSLGTVNSFQVFSGEGVGSYLFVKYKPFKRFQINFKGGFQHYFNQLSIGSGDEEIQGNVKGEIGLEVKYRLK